MIPQIKKILYATDLSKNSSYAFLYAADLAKRENAKIVVLYAVEPIPAYAEVYAAVPMDVQRRQLDGIVKQMQEKLQSFCRRAETEIGPPCVELVTKILVPLGHPPEEILNAADKEECDVIVIGTHGKGFLAHTFLGSVSSSVLHRTRKPVFIIPLPSEKITVDWDGI